MTPPARDRLRRLEGLLVTLRLKPNDLMSQLRNAHVTKGRFLHELTAEQVEEQIADAERSAERIVKGALASVKPSKEQE